MTRRAAALLAAGLAALAPVNAPPRSPFEFRVGFWNSLHHHLHASVRPRPVAALDVPATSRDAEALKAGWTRALRFYTPLGRRSLLFDDGLAALSQALSAAGNAETLDTVPVSAEARAALEAAAPAYRALRWPAHEREARAFEAGARVLVDRHGRTLAAAVAAAYGTTWPARPLPVDLVLDAGPPNAHTTVRPEAHVTIGVSDPRHHDLAALEILFHEASHGWDEQLMRALNRAAWGRGVVVRRDLWHAVLFFTAGELTRRELAAAGTHYVPYAEKQAMTTGTFAAVWPAVVNTWTPVLDGTASLDAAAEALVRAVGVPPPGPGR